MKKIITLFSLLNLAFFVNAQVGNPSFETWESPLLHNTINATADVFGLTVYVCDDFDYTEPTHWSSTNQITEGPNLGNIALVTQSATAYDGSSSIRLESQSISLTGYFLPTCTGASQSVDNVSPGLLVNGSFLLDAQSLVDDMLGESGLNALNPFLYPGVGEAIDFIPRSLSGYIQFTSGGTGNDSCIVISGLKKDGEIIGHLIGKHAATSGGWVPFSIDYTHLNCETPDTIVTLIANSNMDIDVVNNEFVISSDFTGVDGSILYVDALHLDTILPSEFPPLAFDDNATIDITQVAMVDVITNDEFCDGVALTPVIDNAGSNGVATINASDEVEYTPNVGFAGIDVVTYYLCNSVPACDTATVTITVNSLTMCNANDDTYGVLSGETITRDVRANDTDCGTTVSIITDPANGTALVESNNFISYSPDVTFVGTDELEYTICSSDVPTQCDTATVYLNVTTSINEIDANLISIHPNPAKNNVNITIELNSLVSVKIYSTVGEVVKENEFNNSTIIDLDNLTNGIYFVEIKAEGKRSIQKLQVIK